MAIGNDKKKIGLSLPRKAAETVDAIVANAGIGEKNKWQVYTAAILCLSELEPDQILMEIGRINNANGPLKMWDVLFRPPDLNGAATGPAGKARPVARKR